MLHSKLKLSNLSRLNFGSLLLFLNLNLLVVVWKEYGFIHIPYKISNYFGLLLTTTTLLSFMQKRSIIQLSYLLIYLNLVNYGILSTNYFIVNLTLNFLLLFPPLLFLKSLLLSVLIKYIIHKLRHTILSISDHA